MKNFTNNLNQIFTNLLNQILKLNLSQEQKFEIAEIFFSTLTLILIIITIINSPSGGSTLNTIILGIINIKYPFIEAIIHFSTQVNTYLEVLTNVILGIFTILKNIILLIIHNYQMSFMPSVVLCDEGEIQLVKVFAWHLEHIKDYYCGDDFLRYVCRAINTQDSSSPYNIMTFSRPTVLPWKQYGNYWMRGTFYLTDYSYSYRDSEGFDVINRLPKGFSSFGGDLPIRKEYLHEVLNILAGNN